MVNFLRKIIEWFEKRSIFILVFFIGLIFNVLASDKDTNIWGWLLITYLTIGFAYGMGAQSEKEQIRKQEEELRKNK
jgi:hypothetical protein